jgi:uncharacterized protein YggE
MATITVRGQGRVDAQPDEVVVVLRVASVREAPAQAFTDVGERTAALEAVLDELGIAEADRTTGLISVDEYQEHDPTGTPRLRHRAVNALSVRLSGSDQVPALLHAAVERAQAHVQGPSWRLADPSQAQLEACRLAAEDARRRAQAYAEALGLRIGAVERVTEGGDRPVPAGGAYLGYVHAAAEMPIHPSELEVVATAEVTYVLEDA